MSARVILTGELGSLSLFDLAQLFLLAGSTGTLHVQSSGRKGHFRFERGQIWNAVDERLAEGEEAACRLFAWRAGTFEFRVEQPTGGRTIHDSTDGLMLEAARRLDEAGITEGGESMTETLQACAGRFEALREAIQRIAAAATSSAADAKTGARFSVLRSEGDALLYRPGAPVQISLNGRWRTLAPEPMEPAEFLKLCASFFDATAVAGPSGSRCLTVHEDRRELRVTHLVEPHEYLLLRAGREHAGGSVRLTGDTKAITGLLQLPAGLLLVGAPNASAAARLLEATVLGLLEQRSAAVLLATAEPPSDRMAGLGPVVHTDREALERSLTALAPDVVAFDVAHAEDSLAVLHRVPLVVCAVVAPDAASMLTRWLARHQLTATDANRVPLSGAEVGVLYTAEASPSARELPVTAARSRPASPAAGGRLRVVKRSGETPDDLGSVIEGLRRDLREAA